MQAIEAPNQASATRADDPPGDVGSWPMSGRLWRLLVGVRRRHAASVAALGGRLYVDAEERLAYSRAVLEAYRETVGEPAIARRARVLERVAESLPIRMEADDLLAGSQRFCSFSFDPSVAGEIQALGYAKNPGHIVHDYEALLRAGVDGLLDRIRARAGTSAAAEARGNLAAFARAVQAFGRFIERHATAAAGLAETLSGARRAAWRRHAADLHALVSAPPRTFPQALQLVWFAQIFLHAENPSAAISFGRLDQFLGPFLERDLAAGRLTRAQAADLLGAFFLRCCEGEESQNLAVGGVDAAGGDATNALSILVLEVMRRVRTVQPSLTVRLHPGSPPALVHAACQLAALGMGQPGFVNDEAVIPGLLALGIPLERARDYAIVGCYEATTQGDCYPNTVGGAPTALPKLLVQYLRSTAAAAARDFAAFLEGWFAGVQDDYDRALKTAFQPRWNTWAATAPSPFGSSLMGGCIAAAQPLEAGGARFNLFGVNLLGLGTVVDGLYAVDELVYRRRELPLADLAAAVAADWPAEALRTRVAALPERFGTDSAATNRLARTVSERIARMVLASRMDHGVRPYPGFFRFTADIRDHDYATPDGRRRADLLSYGCGPAGVGGAPPTAVLASAAQVAHTLCACGNPLALSLTPADIAGPAGIDRLRSLVLGYFGRGGFHIHFNAVPADVLRRAQAEPGRFAALTIRISGLSARFVTLPRDIQDALISRAETGV